MAISKYIEAQRLEARLKDLAEQEAEALRVSPAEIKARFAAKRMDAIRKVSPDAAELALAAKTITADELAAAKGETVANEPEAQPEPEQKAAGRKG